MAPRAEKAGKRRRKRSPPLPLTVLVFVTVGETSDTRVARLRETLENRVDAVRIVPRFSRSLEDLEALVHHRVLSTPTVIAVLTRTDEPVMRLTRVPSARKLLHTLRALLPVAFANGG